MYRGQKTHKGRVSVRHQHYQYRPHDKVWVDGQKYTVKGVISNGTRIALQERLPVSINKIKKQYMSEGGIAQRNRASSYRQAYGFSPTTI